MQGFNCLRQLPGLDLVKLTRERQWLQDATTNGMIFYRETGIGGMVPCGTNHPFHDLSTLD